MKPLLSASGLSLSTPAGRPLFRDLNLSLGREQVAIVGRNGSGKTTLLEVLAGRALPDEGHVDVTPRCVLVPQNLISADMGADRPLSRGEQRRAALERARRSAPQLLLLDEPTDDLDDAGIAWLLEWLVSWRGGLIVVSHHPQLLERFEHFFLVRESGCRYFRGRFGDLMRHRALEEAEDQNRYVSNLHGLIAREAHHAKIRRIRGRKKNLGRIHEEGRCPTRAQLKGNKGLAQASQGRRARIQEQRLGAARSWLRAMRRALAVKLPLELVLPEPSPSNEPAIVLEAISKSFADRKLFESVTLELGASDRVAVVGPNGAGKTSLLQIALGASSPDEGWARQSLDRIGVIGQGAADWCLDESLAMRLSSELGPDDVAQHLVAHKFPLALADRPLASLSPGERVRAALICLMQRRPVVEILVLDEPTDSLDFEAVAALSAALRAWRGGLLVVSHDRAFLERIGIDRTLELGTAVQSRKKSGAGSMLGFIE